MGTKKYETHSREFREEAVRQARESRGPLSRVARDLGVNYGTLRLWVNEAKAAERDEPGTDLASENRRLRAENRQLRLEREILKKATAFFAKHSK